MTSMKLACLALVAALLVIVSAPRVHAQSAYTYISNTGADSNPCTAALPCATIAQAASTSFSSGSGGQVSCLNLPSIVENNFTFQSYALTVDCFGVVSMPGGNSSNAILTLAGSNQVVKIRNLTFNGQPNGGSAAIQFTGSGTLILENCVFENFPGGAALQIEPTGPFSLVIKNSRISNNAAGVLIQPFVIGGGIDMKPSVNATFDHVTVAQNSGGGIHTDSSDGPITVDIADSTISDNASNGFNVTSGTRTHNNMVNIIRTTIANNGLVGIQSGGNNAAVLLNASTLDSNTNGATDALNGARILSYGNNQIIGTPGSGFTGSAALQ